MEINTHNLKDTVATKHTNSDSTQKEIDLMWDVQRSILTELEVELRDKFKRLQEKYGLSHDCIKDMNKMLNDF